MSLKYFNSDLESASLSKNNLIKLKFLLLCHTLHLTLLIRLGQSLSKLPLFGNVFRIFFELFIRVLYASDISLKATIGPGLSIMHGHDIVIGADVTIGEDCKIFNGVTLGNKNIYLSSKGNQPTIGDRVVLSTGVKVLGPVFIDDDCVVGANAVVVKNCAAGFTYVGIPAARVK
jgi:serine O-acetyltransferase